jgi:putative acetyltransferase
MSGDTPTDLLIRPLLAADLPQTLDMWVDAWQAAYPAIDFKARRSWTADRIAELERTGSRSLIVEQGNRIVGALVVNPDTGYLDQIVVATDCQGRGVAEMLLAEAQRLSPAGLHLHVNQDNARAIGFYEKHGFAKTGEDVNPRSGAPVYNMSWRSG